MRCQRCGGLIGSSYATVNGAYFCDNCARDMKIEDVFRKQASLFEQAFPILGELTNGIMGTPADLDFGNNKIKCPKCGTTLRELDSKGVLGCIECYNTYNETVLKNILKKQGSSEYIGRKPGVEAGIEVNEELPNYYKSWHKAEGDANTIFTALDTFYQIREPNLETDTTYQGLYENAKSFSDTAFFVVSRHAGENSDPPHYQTKVEGQATDNTRGYLEISTEEEDMLKRVCEDFDNVIVVINSTNTMTLDFVEKIEGIDACISVGATGVQGALAIPEILYGMDKDENLVSPSGHLTDTVSYRPEFNVTYFRSCAKHTRYYEGGSSYKTMGAGGSAFYQQSCYVEYAEGIYIGYRWFETADAEGYWDSPEFINNWDSDWVEQYNVGELGGYDTVVQYPFGFGMSYTSFDWKLVEANVRGSNSKAITNTDIIDLKVEVTNTGSRPGKDVIEVFLHQPYTPGGIEKSEVKLVAYAKSPELQPGQKANVEIEVETKEFKSYDCYDDNGNGHKGYEMDEGDYILELHTDAHNIKDMEDNSIKYRLAETLNIDEDEKTGNTVENRFTGCGFNDTMPGENDIEFKQFSRRDFEETFPTHPTFEDRKVKEGSRYEEFLTHTVTIEEFENGNYDYIPEAAHKTKQDFIELIYCWLHFCGWQFSLWAVGNLFCFIVGDGALGAPGPKGCSACFDLPMV